MDLALLERNLVFATFWASFISFLFFLASVVTKRKDSEKSQITSILGYVGMVMVLVLSTGALIAKAVVTQHVPWSNFYESMVFMAAIAALLFLIIFRVYKHDLMGVIMSPGIALLVGIASLLPPNFRGNGPLVPALQSYWIKIHTTSMIVSYSVFLLATTTAIAYLIMHYIVARNFRNGSAGKQLNFATTGPSLNNINMVEKEDEDSEKSDTRVSSGSVSVSMDKALRENPNLAFFDDVTYRLILLGFPILAFGIITGAMWANHAWGNYWSWDPKETASLMTWLFYGAYIHSRVNMSMKGKTSAILAVVGFVAVIFTYYGVNYLPGLHSYGFSVEQ